MQVPNLSRLTKNRTVVVLGVALAVGLLAAFAAQTYLSRKMAEIEARGRGQTVSVVVAKRDLRRGERVSEETVAVRPVPVDFSHSQAIRPEQFPQIVGQALDYPLKSGEMLLWGLLEGKKVATFSSRVETGRRALTVPVDEINSMSGLLEPGDRVDLMLTLERSGRKHSFLLEQKVAVLATGQRSIDDPRSGERRNFSTVTLDTSPEQARIIIRAREAGKLSALLRNPSDTADLSDDPMAAKILRDLEVEMRQVPVLYGGRGNALPAEGLRLGQAPVADPAQVAGQVQGLAETLRMALPPGGGGMQ